MGESFLKKNCFWRQTGGCSKDGSNREPSKDLPCTNSVPPDASGFCDCDGNGKMDHGDFGYGCDSTPGTCLNICLSHEEAAAGFLSSPRSSGGSSLWLVFFAANASAGIALLAL